MANNNWMVIINTKEGTELKGIYPTKRAAQFISGRVKILDRLPYYPKVVPTSAGLYPTGNKVEDYLAYVESRNNDMYHRKKVIKYLPRKQ